MKRQRTSSIDNLPVGHILQALEQALRNIHTSCCSYHHSDARAEGYVQDLIKQQYAKIRTAQMNNTTPTLDHIIALTDGHIAFRIETSTSDHIYVGTDKMLYRKRHETLQQIDHSTTCYQDRMKLQNAINFSAA